MPAGDDAKTGYVTPLLPAVRECDLTTQPWTSRFKMVILLHMINLPAANTAFCHLLLGDSGIIHFIVISTEGRNPCPDRREGSFKILHIPLHSVQGFGSPE